MNFGGTHPTKVDESYSFCLLINFNASLLLKEFNFVLSINLITHCGSVLLYSLRIQPIALFTKNSLEFSNEVMIYVNNVVSRFFLYLS